MSLMGKGDANRTRSAPGQVAPDTAYLSTANSQRVGRQRRREGVCHLKKPAPRSQQLETGFDDGSLNLQREPFNRQARDNGGQPLDMAGEILADSRRIALDNGCSRKVSPQHRGEARLLLDGNDALERTASPHEAASQAAGSGPQFEDRSRSFQFDKTRESVGEMEATWVRRCYLQWLLQPKAEENCRIRRHAIIRP